MLYLIIFAIGFTGASVWAAPPELALVLAANMENVSKYKNHWWAAKLIQYQTNQLFALVLCATAGSALGSSIHYFLGRATTNLSKKFQEKISRVDLARFKTSGFMLVFVSAAFSLPPFLAVSLAAGFIRFPFVKYVVPSFLGKCARYTLAAYAGEELGRLFFKVAL